MRSLSAPPFHRLCCFSYCVGYLSLIYFLSPLLLIQLCFSALLLQPSIPNNLNGLLNIQQVVGVLIPRLFHKSAKYSLLRLERCLVANKSLISKFGSLKLERPPSYNPPARLCIPSQAVDAFFMTGRRFCNLCGSTQLFNFPATLSTIIILRR